MPNQNKEYINININIDKYLCGSEILPITVRRIDT